MEDINWEVVKYILQIVITVSGAFLAAWLATRRYRSDKWWDKKEAAYSELINALHQMKWPASEHIDAEFENRTINEEESEKLWREFKDARKNIWRIAESSSFLLSSDVLITVRQMEKDLGKARNAHTWFDHLDDQYGAVDKCLKDIKDIGKKDLGLKDT